MYHDAPIEICDFVCSYVKLPKEDRKRIHRTHRGMEPTKEITSIQARDPKQCCKNMTKRYQGRFWKISAEDCGQNLLDRVSVEAAVPNPFAENLSKVSRRDLHARSL